MKLTTIVRRPQMQVHCAYRGCMKPLTKAAIRCDDDKCYCDTGCKRRADRLAGLPHNEKATG